MWLSWCSSRACLNTNISFQDLNCLNRRVIVKRGPRHKHLWVESQQARQRWLVISSSGEVCANRQYFFWNAFQHNANHMASGNFFQTLQYTINWIFQNNCLHPQSKNRVVKGNQGDGEGGYPALHTAEKEWAVRTQRMLVSVVAIVGEITDLFYAFFDIAAAQKKEPTPIL